MPKNMVCVSVFLSLPSNMSDYIERIETLISDFNDVFGFERGILFRTIYWKKNIVGQVTNDAQLSINDQLLNEYDLMIAVIGDRLGEATARAESGTAEEIRMAVSKIDPIFSGKHVQIMFRTKLDSNINYIDVEQINKVKEFKKSIYKSALIAEFHEDDEVDGIVNRFLNSACQQLERSLAGHINKFALEKNEDQQILKVENHVEFLSDNLKNDNNIEKSDDNLGFYDELEAANNAARSQAELIKSYGQILSEMTEQLKEILGKYGDDQQKKRFDEIGAMLSLKAKGMKLIVDGMNETSKQHSASFENVLLMLEEFDSDDSRKAVKDIRNALSGAVSTMSDFLRAAIEGKEATERNPRATQRFNQGRRQAAAVMGEMIAITEFILNRFGEYVSYLDAFLERVSEKKIE